MKDYDFSQMEQNFQSIYDSMTFENQLNEQEKEEERKKKEELDGQAYVHMQEKAEEYAKQPFGPKIDLDDAKTIFQPVNIFDVFAEDLEHDINAEFAKDSIGITISNGKLTPDGVHKARDLQGSLPKEDQAICDSLTILDTFSDRAKSLAKFKEQLLATQKDPKANTPGGGKEGPEDYRKLLASIDQYIALESKKMNGEVTLDQLSKKFSEVNTLGQKYLVKHKPNIAGHKSEETARRYDVIGNLVDDGRVARNVLSRNIKSINKTMSNSEKGIAFENMGKVKVKELAPRLFQKYATNPDRSMEDYVVYSKYKKSFQTGSEKSKMYRTDVLNNLRRCAKSNKNIKIDDYVYNRGPIFKPGKYNSYEYAQAYIAKKQIDTLKKHGMTYSWASEIRRQTDPVEFNKQVKELSGKPAFQALKGFRPSTVLDDWGVIEQRADISWQKYNNNYMKLHSGSIDKKIAALKKTNEIIDKQLIINLAYNSIMADEKNKEIIESIHTLNGLGYKSEAKLLDRQVTNAIERQLEQSGVMKDMVGRPIEDLPRLLHHINDRDMHKNLSKSSKSAAKDSFKKSVNRIRQAQKNKARVKNNQTNVQRQNPQNRGPQMGAGR